MNSKTSDFFKSFKPFLGSKKGSNGRDIINIEINSEIEKDQSVVAVELSKYFSTLADDIGGSNTILLTETSPITTQTLSNSPFPTSPRQKLRRPTGKYESN